MDRPEQIKMLRDHIAQGERHVVSQCEIVRRLADLGADTTLAVELLAAFEAALAEHRRHLDRATGQLE